jgi:hypothetical protein
MRREFDIEQLLRWRVERAESDAPLPPDGLRLLKRARPWWEIVPERFAAQVRRLGAIQVSYGYAMAQLHHGHSGHPVPTLISRDDEELESPARVLYVNVRDGRLRLRFHLDPIPRTEQGFEVTFISETALQPIFSAYATLSVDGEYRLDADLPGDLATTWESLKVTDRMPFRFILRPAVDSTDTG